MSPQDSRKFFFVHVMKTGGSTLRRHIRNNFLPGNVYPEPAIDHCPDPHRAHTDIRSLLALPAERRARLRVYMGHFPYIAAELMGEPLTTLTLLRDPVERTISYLKQCKRDHSHHRDLRLEEIYEDRFHYPSLINNHQAKIFSMRPGDRLESYMDVIDVDESRLQAARDNLEKVDVLGLQSQYGQFLEALTTRFGWRFDDLPNRRVSQQTDQVSEAFRRRIADDNAMDMAFYDHARDLYERRRARPVR